MVRYERWEFETAAGERRADTGLSYSVQESFAVIKAAVLFVLMSFAHLHRAFQWGFRNIYLGCPMNSAVVALTKVADEIDTKVEKNKAKN